jgi:hypothetical protein
MKNMPMCPMMMSQMPMMPMMNMPMAQMPMMQSMNMEDMNHDHGEDDKDEEYFAGMYGESHRIMMVYVVKTVDKMEKKGDMLYAEYPDREMVERMSEESYNNMIKDMPEMADESEEDRQYYGRRRLARDLIGVLLINELLGRRRRRRRRPYGGYPGYGFSSPYGYDYNDFYYNE